MVVDRYLDELIGEMHKRVSDEDSDLFEEDLSMFEFCRRTTEPPACPPGAVSLDEKLMGQVLEERAEERESDMREWKEKEQRKKARKAEKEQQKAKKKKAKKKGKKQRRRKQRRKARQAEL